jgi:hypothetical protein
LSRPTRRTPSRAGRDVAGDHRPLGLEIDAGLDAAKHHVLRGAQEQIARRRAEQGFRLAFAFGDAQIGAGAHPAWRARQRRQAHRRFEGEGVARLAMVEGLGQVLQLRLQKTPVVEHLLQPPGDAAGMERHAQIVRHHHQLAITRAIPVACKFHGRAL